MNNLTKLPLLGKYIAENKFPKETFVQQWKTIKRKHQIRQKFLTTTFSAISNTELLEEFRKRVAEQQVIKLSLDTNRDYISGEVKDGKFTFIAYLPIEFENRKRKTKKSIIKQEIITP